MREKMEALLSRGNSISRQYELRDDDQEMYNNSIYNNPQTLKVNDANKSSDLNNFGPTNFTIIENLMLMDSMNNATGMMNNTTLSRD